MCVIYIPVCSKPGCKNVLDSPKSHSGIDICLKHPQPCTLGAKKYRYNLCPEHDHDKSSSQSNNPSTQEALPPSNKWTQDTNLDNKPSPMYEHFSNLESIPSDHDLNLNGATILKPENPLPWKLRVLPPGFPLPSSPHPLFFSKGRAIHGEIPDEPNGYPDKMAEEDVKRAVAAGQLVGQSVAAVESDVLLGAPAAFVEALERNGKRRGKIKADETTMGARTILHEPTQDMKTKSRAEAGPMPVWTMLADGYPIPNVGHSGL